MADELVDASAESGNDASAADSESGVDSAVQTDSNTATSDGQSHVDGAVIGDADASVSDGSSEADSTTPNPCGIVAGPDLIEVKNFGVTGDGITDDTSAFQTALASLASGQKLHVPAGVYRVSKLTVPSNAMLAGETGAILKGITAGASILTIDAHDVTVCGLTIDGDKKSKQAITINANSSNITVKSCEIRNTYGDKTSGSWSILLWGGKNIAVTDCYFHDVDGPENGVDGDNVGANRAIWASAVATMVISNCVFEEIRGFEDGDCIQIQEKSTDITIQDCTFRKFYKRAIKVQSPAVKIIHNNITSNPTADSTKDFEAAISIFAGNTIVDNNTILLYDARLGVDLNGTYCQITNNNISVDKSGKNTNTAGIYVSSQGSYSTVKGNTIRNIPDAIEVNKSTVGVVVSNNDIQ